MVRPVSSETRSPVWAASLSRVWSRRPCQVVVPAAPMSASTSAWVRKDTMSVRVRLAGMASTRLIRPACSGACSEA